VIQRLKKLFRTSGFFKNILLLIGGTGIAQAIPFVLQPVLRRVYTPEDFGAFAVFFSLICFLTVIANFRYDLAISLPESDEEASRILNLSLVLNLAFNIVLFLIILCFKNEIADIFKFPKKFSGFLFLLPLSTFLFCSFQSMNYWLIRKKAFRALSVNKISRRGAEGLVQLFFGLFRNGAGLFWADVAGSLSNNISGLRQLKKAGFRFPSFSVKSLMKIMRKYSHFPKYNLLPNLLGTLAMQFPVFIINKLFTKTELGFYDLTQQAIMAPFVLITVSVSQVLLQRVNEKRHKGEQLFTDLFRLTGILLAIGIASVIIIELWGPALFSVVFGSKWILAGSYARTLIIGYLFFLVVAPLNAFLLGLERIRMISLWNIIHFLLIGSLIFLGHVEFITFLRLFAGLEALVFLTLFFMVYKALKEYEQNLPVRN
jgi:O-antigen/teichoic acid export membrane protein